MQKKKEIKTRSENDKVKFVFNLMKILKVLCIANQV